ncbi:MAG: hypothetical protein RJB66_310 [Pseudomonadota bacterium]|jgi:hypothetical protein
MKFIFVLLFSSLLASNINAENFNMTDNLRAVSIQACSMWISGSPGNGYVCANIPSASLVAEARSFAFEIRRLQDVITSLEKRIEVLEKK